jgi:hypothetical protein
MATDLDEQASTSSFASMRWPHAGFVHRRVSRSRAGETVGDDADVLVRHKGDALDALQVIVNTAFGREARGDRHYVDAGFPQGQGRGIAADGPAADG